LPGLPEYTPGKPEFFQGSTGNLPGTMGLGYDPTLAYRGPRATDLLASNPNLSPTILGGTESLGYYVDRNGNIILAPAYVPPGYADGGPADKEMGDTIRALMEFRDEQGKEAEEGSSRQMLESFLANAPAYTETSYDMTPVSQSVKRTTQKVGKKRTKKGEAKGASFELESLTQGVPDDKQSLDSRMEMEMLANQYRQRAQALDQSAKGLMRQTFNAGPLAQDTLSRRGDLLARRFAEGGEADSAILPLQVRTYLESVLSNKKKQAPLTTKDFSSEELEKLRAFIDLAEESPVRSKKTGKELPGIASYAHHREFIRRNMADGSLPLDVLDSDFNIGPSGSLRNTLGTFKFKRMPDGSIQVNDVYDYEGDVALSDNPLVWLAQKRGVRRPVSITIPPVKRAEGSPETGETSQEELRRLMRLMNPDAEQIEEAAIAAPRVAGTVGAFGSGLMDQLRGLAALPGQALDFGRGTLQKIRELSPEELRGQAPAMDTESVDAFVAAAQRAKEDPKGEAAKALAAVSDYLKQGTSSPEAFAQMLGENVPLPGPSRTRTPPVTRMAEESPPPGGPLRQFSGRLDNFVAGLSGPVRKDQFLGQLSNKFRNYEVERARQALAELPDDAKLTPQQLSERLSATLNPGDLTTKIIPPSAGGGFYQSYDNPYPDRPLGVIHLNKDIPIAPEDLAKVEAIERLRQEPLFKGGSFNLANIIYNPDPEQNQRVLTLLRESGAETPVTESTFRELVGQLDEVKRLANETRVPINRLSYYKTAVEAPGATDRNSDVVRFRPPTEDTPSFWEVQKNLKEGYVEADRAAGVLPDHFGHSKKASRLAKKIVFLDAIDNLIKMAEPAASKSPRFPRSASENLEYLKELRAVIQEHPGWVQDPFYNPRANLPASSQNIFKKREKAFGDAESLVSLDDQLRLDSGGLGPSRDSKVFEAFTGVADSLFELEEAKADAAIRSASSALKGLVKHAEETAPRIYKGQHPTLLGGANPVAFSRFSEHTADIPELGNVKGIYVTELQSDLLQDVRRRGIKGRTLEMDNVELDQLAKEESALRKRLRTVPKLASGIRARLFDTDAVVLDEKQRKTLDSDLKQNLARQKVLKERVGRTKLEPKEAYQFFEPFANMETSPQILQQLLIKNTVGAAVQRGDSFVAFPGAQSKQAQLYENLPNNLKQVAKDLGPGFEVRLLTLPDSKGNPLTHPAVIWGPEAAARVAQKGVPFAKGGEVKTLATFPRPY
jgi:hypothetical protein